MLEGVNLVLDRIWFWTGPCGTCGTDYGGREPSTSKGCLVRMRQLTSSSYGDSAWWIKIRIRYYSRTPNLVRYLEAKISVPACRCRQYRSLRDLVPRSSTKLSDLLLDRWVELEQIYASIRSTSKGRMRSGVAQALRPRVWHDCALFFFDLGISYFAGFGSRLGRILAVQNQINPFYM